MAFASAELFDEPGACYLILYCMHTMRTEQVASAAAEATDKLVSHCRLVLTCSQYLVVST